MTEPRLLLCTDMDRTVIPNGEQQEDSQARHLFSAFCNLPQVTLVYVTGRHLQLVEQAINEFDLPLPDYIISDVGTKIYALKNKQWLEHGSWVKQISADWQGKSHQQLVDLFSDLPELELQPATKQNTHKLSYFVSLQKEHEPLMDLMQQRLQKLGVLASLVWSVDEISNTGLLDVLPRHATKLHAIEFLYQQLNYTLPQVVFAGDSGNDIPVLVSGVASVLVANASTEVKQLALSLAQQNGHAQSLYCASGRFTNMNGNYTAGVLEGVCYFMPSFSKILKQLGIRNE